MIYEVRTLVDSELVHFDVVAVLASGAVGRRRELWAVAHGGDAERIADLRGFASLLGGFAARLPGMIDRGLDAPLFVGALADICTFVCESRDGGDSRGDRIDRGPETPALPGR